MKGTIWKAGKARNRPSRTGGGSGTGIRPGILPSRHGVGRGRGAGSHAAPRPCGARRPGGTRGEGVAGRQPGRTRRKESGEVPAGKLENRRALSGEDCFRRERWREWRFLRKLAAVSGNKALAAAGGCLPMNPEFRSNRGSIPEPVAVYSLGLEERTEDLLRFRREVSSNWRRD